MGRVKGHVLPLAGGSCVKSIYSPARMLSCIFFGIAKYLEVRDGLESATTEEVGQQLLMAGSVVAVGGGSCTRGGGGGGSSYVRREAGWLG